MKKKIKWKYSYRKKKAFSLVELLAVLAILGIAVLLTTPIIIKIIETARKEAWRDTAYGIVESARLYYTEHILSEPVTKEVIFDFDHGVTDDLKFSGTIPDGGIVKVNEKGQTSIAIHNHKWCATKSYLESKVSLKTYREGTCVDAEVAKDPMITLKGKEEDQVGQGQTYVDPGAEAKTLDGTPLKYVTEITKAGTVVNKIDTSKVGDIYTIIYTAESNGKKASVNRTVTVIDMIPVINFTEANSNYVKSQNVAIWVSAIFPNKIDRFYYQIDDGEKVEASGTNTVITLNETGEHRITVTVTDNKGYHASKTSDVYKIDTTGPVITFDPDPVKLETEDVTEYNLLTGVTVTDNVDGDIAVTKETVKTTGELLKIPNTYKIMYTVKDKLGNETNKERTFIVKDFTKPVITITPMEQNTFVKMQTITIHATDNMKLDSIHYVLIKDGVRGESVLISDGGTVTVNTTGNYQVEVTAIDHDGNVATKLSGIYKIDTTGPVVTLDPEIVKLKITEVSNYNLYNGVSAIDNADGPVPINQDSVKIVGSLAAIEGTQKITYIVRDKLGNETSKERTFIVVEAEGPILNFSAVDTGGKWLKKIDVTVTATDKSNLQRFTYEVFKNGISQGVREVSVNGNSASAVVSLTSEGTYRIKLYAIDEYGNDNTAYNTQSSSDGGYWIDTTRPEAPTVTLRKGSSTGSLYTSNTWSNQNVYAILSYNKTDSSGISYYEYSNNGLTWYRMNSNPMIISQDGTTTLYFRAVDKAGNIGISTGQYIIKIDKIAPSSPTVTMRKGSSNGSIYNSDTWSSQTVYVSLSYGKTDTSGISHYEYSNNGSTWYKMTSNTTSISTVGKTTIYFRAVDNASNNGTSSSGWIVKIDQTAPSAPTIVMKKGNSTGATYTSDTWVNQNVYISLSYSKTDTSGIAYYEYSNNGSTWYKMSSNTTTVSQEGSTNWYFRAVDTAENKGAQSSKQIVKIDKTAPVVPTVKMNLDRQTGLEYKSGTWTNKKIYVTLSTSKSDSSGISHYEYSTSGSGWSKMTDNPMIIRDEGTKDLYFRSVDNAGNPSTKTTQYSFKYDSIAPSAPTITIRKGSANGSLYTSGTWTPLDLYITGSYSKYDTSGIEGYQMSTDNRNWTIASTSASRINVAGQYTVYLRAVDKAGNVGTAQLVTKVYKAKYLVDSGTGNGFWVNYQNTYWRIVGRSGKGSTGTVTLATASCVGGNLTLVPKSTSIISYINSSIEKTAKSFYNSSYISSYRPATTTDASGLLRNATVGCAYWAKPPSPTATVYYINSNSTTYQSFNQFAVDNLKKTYSGGARVIVVTKPGIYVTTANNGASQSTAWTISY